jgi:hypothetical protein
MSKLHEATTSGTRADAGGGFPPAGRYQIEGRLGGGGMGEVFKAFDPDLGRHVALKFLKGDDPALLARFEREARAQARLEHEHICKVFEVGAVDGRHYIAMQFVAGDTLRDSAWRMTLEQKVGAIRDVASALHAAHKLGLVHRDVKPGNILVEPTESGGWHAYVTDFGIVRDQTGQGMTVTGVVVGTPGFMAPEQLRGKDSNVDRRADVYGLGATLYALFAGRPPFGDEATADVMVRVLESEPPPLSRSVPEIPEDLETVVMKCLEKEPQRRYESARALAEDLQRYLDAEPISARRPTIAYRLRKKARKHRAAVVVGVAAAVLLAGLGAWTLQQRAAAGRRERLARRFGQEIREIESVMRIGHLLPLHDTRVEREIVKQRMAAIERDLPADALGPAAYALGQGSLALGDTIGARRQLERAWASGYRPPEVAYALGQVMGALYRSELQDAVRLSTQELVAARRAQIAKEYLTPALEYLKQSRGSDLEAPEYLDALLAFYASQHEAARAKARAAATRLPWMYEARQLEGEVFQAEADDLAQAGKYDAARTTYSRAEESYALALATARSDGRIAERLASLHLDRMEMELYGPGRDVAGEFSKGLAACETALAADPASAEALRVQAGLFGRMAEYERDQGADPRPRLARAIDAASLSARLDPSVRAYVSLEESYRIRADYELTRGIDPTDSVRGAQDACTHALALKARDPDVHNSLGLAYRALAGYESRHGLDPRANLGRAIEAYAKAIAGNPRYAYPYNNAGNAHAELAAYALDHGEDPRPHVEQARIACARATEINPDFPYPPNNLAAAEGTLGLYELRHGQDPNATLDRAIAAAEKSTSLKAAFAPAYTSLGQAWAIRAELAWLRGGDPGRETDAAVAAGRKALAINPQLARAWTVVASAHLVAARAAQEHGHDPGADCNEVRLSTQRAIDVDAGSVESHRLAALAAIVEARHAIATGGDPQSALADAGAHLGSAQRINADNVWVAEARAEAALWKARALLRRGRPALAEIEAGLSGARDALRLDPMLAEARALEGLLLIAQARASAQPGLAEQGRQAVRQAIAENTYLGRLYESELR